MNQPSPPDQAPASAIERLKRGNLALWPHISAAAALSRERLGELRKMAADLLPRDEGAFVVFGSLARGEFTEGSDLDWTILIDGRADTEHLAIAHALTHKLEERGFKCPGPTETFGGLVFSHDLIHAIGGDDDTNKNMTRRLLLLLESAAVPGNESIQVHKRVIEGVLYRYVEEDASFISAGSGKKSIPRFLLNDVVRFWRTMAVDYANKYRAREGHKWALRNIKLRMSRKLIFLSGFLMCVSWALDEHDDKPEFLSQKLVEHLEKWSRRAPLESLAMAIELYAPNLASDVFGTYDAFLGVLADQGKRERLERLEPNKAYSDDVFLEARSGAQLFDRSLTQLIFESSTELTALVRKYGVF